MSQKIALILQFIAVVAVLVAVGMEFRYIMIPALYRYKFWVVVGAFGLLFSAQQAG